ncbi:MAG: hypothetical protein M3209_05420 [Acidobacteriota bacterium]|nr:hypothetical protein [Acidobacteriota bacterium]
MIKGTSGNSTFLIKLRAGVAARLFARAPDFVGSLRMAVTLVKAVTETAGDKNSAESHSRHKKLGEGFLRFAG